MIAEKICIWSWLDGDEYRNIPLMIKASCGYKAEPLTFGEIQRLQQAKYCLACGGTLTHADATQEEQQAREDERSIERKEFFRKLKSRIDAFNSKITN